MATLVHLVRHGEVENPLNIWYGRMEGFGLSERGRRQAEVLGRHFAGRKIEAVFSSPMERALQTAAPIAQAVGVEVAVVDDIIESYTKLQGKTGNWRMFRNPLLLRHFLLPSRPSWGEPYLHIRKRMSASLVSMARAHEGGEVVAVSHMTPILVARLWAGQNRRAPWRAKLACTHASITTLEFEGEQWGCTGYLEVGAEVI